MKLLGKGQTRVRYLLAAAVVAFTPFAANAVPLNFTFTGAIDTFSLTGGASGTGDLDVGDSVSGSFTYDGSLVPVANGRVHGPGTISGFSITVGGFSYTTTGTSQATLDDDRMPGSAAPETDYFSAAEGQLIGSSQGGLVPRFARFSILSTSNLSIFQAGISPSLADFQQLIADNESSGNTNFIAFANGPILSTPRITARFNLTEVTVSAADPAVPLSAPATLPLMAASLGLLGFIARRRKG